MSHLLNVRCPSCQSKQLSTTEKSGGKLTLTCLSCGYVFKAVDTDTTPQKIVEQPFKPANPATDSALVQPAFDLSALNRQIVEIVKATGKLNAIKFCKDNTGWSLDKCKQYVDQLVDKGQGNEWSIEEPLNLSGAKGTATLAQRVIEIARTKGKLHAVKYYKDCSGKGLKESLEYVEKIVPPDVYKKTEGCFIATACYGDYDAKEVLVLRRYRDNVLQQRTAGRLAVKVYYYVSPALAHFIQDKAPLKKIIRKHVLQPLIKRLSDNTDDFI
ncbi:CFI-box-CTERM domain-containing protein [Niabella yanshanensis]|uniref:CFI-box-CTERM domain-containing protein n=1 Tax=Niabella yanshanensis TaxID=577386 RepID=A0ABZ0WBP8_9BACT|nr:CFI-box-CTERM domain-containing protein [Niabella yanshanensis]WQD40621.1 CFI-box-CTERM domain-containing protein [Niabella yanshanensis]